MRLLLQIMLLAVGFIPVAFANHPTNANRSLDAINQSIQKIQNELNQDDIKRSQLEKTLQQAEISAGSLNNDLMELNQELIKEQALLLRLKSAQRDNQGKLQNQQQDLANEIKTLYYLQNHNYFETLLNQSNVETLSRNMTYFKYFNQSRLEHIQEIQHTLTQIKQQRTQIQQQSANLQIMQQAKLQRQAQLKTLQQARKTILDKLNQQILSSQQTLKELEKNKARLQNLFDNLSSTTITQTPIQPPLPFEGMKGKLPWPTQGKITTHFGQAIGNSQLTSTGVVILAPQGQHVYAIYPGKVIFANWLKGFGLLMIVNQGNGYMTLYGRNDSLYHKVGDFVNSGDLLATVGDSGGYDQTGLYFEIRENGNPIDPEGWCS